eukprot:11516220-Alexandrium_andersonii.AAC.1
MRHAACVRDSLGSAIAHSDRQCPSSYRVVRFGVGLFSVRAGALKVAKRRGPLRGRARAARG